MNAVEFIKKYGWEEAKSTVNFFSGIFHKLDESGNVIFTFEIKDLKQLVDAWGLVESKGGLYQAKKHYLDMREAINQVYYRHSCDFESQELKQAIELVESVNE